MTKEREALNIAIDYINERLEDHDTKYRRHPATERLRNNILADIEAVKEALMYQTFERDQPLYTSPPQRTWVGLTDDEIYSIDWKAEPDYARAIEAKLKEKNT